MKARLLACSLVAVLLASAPAAFADCWPLGNVVWSYPASGDVGIPTNVDYWPALGGGSSMLPTLSVGDAGQVELQSNALGGFDLGELEPNTKYTIQHADRLSEIREVVFTTGDGPTANAAAQAPIVDSVSEARANEATQLCRGILGQLDCFDTGDPTWTQVATTAQATAWLVQVQSEPLGPPFVLPAECVPGIFHYGEAPCVRIGAVTEQGVSEMSEWACEDASRPVPRPDASAPEEEDGQSDSGGCNVAVVGPRPGAMLERAGRALPLVLVLGAAGALRRRVRRPPRKTQERRPEARRRSCALCVVFQSLSERGTSGCPYWLKSVMGGIRAPGGAGLAGNHGIVP